SPSLILTCTRRVSPGRNSGRSVRLCLLINLVNSALFICYFLLHSTVQVGTQSPGLLDGRLPPPAADLLVVPAQQDLGNAEAAKFGVARVLRTIQYPVRLAERFHHGGILIPQ